MARIRSVHPGLFIDDAFLELSMAARVVLIGIWVQCDDHGVFEWRPRSLKAAILPGDDGIDMPDLLAELEQAECVRQFDDSGKTYGAVRNFCKWQRPKKATYRYPVPHQLRTYVDPNKASDWSVVPKQSPTGGELSPQRKEGIGEGGGKGKGEPETSTESLESVALTTVDAPPAPPSETLSPDLPASPEELKRRPPRPTAGLQALGTELPPDWIPNDTTCEACKVDFGMTDDDLRTELPAFHAYNVANATYSSDWNKTFYLFCKRWKEHRDKQAPPRVQLSRAPTLPRSTPEDLSEEAWDGIVQLYARTGRWARDAGPDPMHVGRCKAPQHILDRYGIDPQTGERRIPPQKQAVSA